MGPGGRRVVPPGTGGAGGEVPQPPCICRVWVWQRLRLAVRFEWLSRMGVGLGATFGVDLVAGRIWFLVVGGGGPWYWAA